MFYNDMLEPCAKNGAIYWDELSNQDLPLKFLDCDGEESSGDEVCELRQLKPSQRLTVALLASILVQQRGDRYRCSSRQIITVEFSPE